MSNVDELKTVLKQTLDNKGVLGQIKARIRAEVHSALEDGSEMKPQLTHENFLINELIKEYLEFNQYHYTNSVLISESGQPKESVSREVLAHELNMMCNDSLNVPLLYRVVNSLMSQKCPHSSKGTDEPEKADLQTNPPVVTIKR